MTTIVLHNYGSVKPLAVLLPANCTCETALKEVARTLHMREESLNVFALFCGPLERPVRVLRPSDSVPTSTELSVQRWCMQVDEGKTVLRHDYAALHLLFCQAKAKIERGDMQPSQEQLYELESFSDPAFPTERQYIEVARCVSGYATIFAKGCIVTEAIDDNAVKIPAGGCVTVSMDFDGLAVTNEANSTQRLHWAWTVVRRWKRMAAKDSTIIKFEVCVCIMLSATCVH